ncbi:DNA-binding transcriptional regulator, LysR family [Halopseudomonas litoralis]|uniref:DNA-binding transcriptional regulator, LysR family n=2 Tax=Halopseudomonas litoralis TaxID=797277 RepID=A0A1H1Q832_9GAMM|nr:DNA-binding transcriptional regulator, LysR family [Halopseudomonas litoralis]
MAARSLGLRYSTLRNEITRLEEHLDMRLFHSTNGRAKLTLEGEQLFQLSEKLLDENATTAMYGEQSDLVLSIPTLVLEGFLYRELISILRENSGLKVSLVDDAPEMQETADLVIWLQEPRDGNELRRKLTQPRQLSTLSFSPYVTERMTRGRAVPAGLEDMEHFMTVQYDGYESFSCFGEWNDFIAQRRHSAIHVDSPQAQWQMIRWANCIGLLPDKSAYLNSGVRRLPAFLDTALELDVWSGLNTRSAHIPDARMIAKRVSRVFRSQ